jgi:ATP/ADP translocase
MIHTMTMMKLVLAFSSMVYYLYHHQHRGCSLKQNCHHCNFSAAVASSYGILVVAAKDLLRRKIKKMLQSQLQRKEGKKQKLVPTKIWTKGYKKK